MKKLLVRLACGHLWYADTKALDNALLRIARLGPPHKLLARDQELGSALGQPHDSLGHRAVLAQEAVSGTVCRMALCHTGEVQVPRALDALAVKASAVVTNENRLNLFLAVW